MQKTFVLELEGCIMHNYGEITQRRLHSSLFALQNEEGEEDREASGKSRRHRSVIKHNFSMSSEYQTRTVASHPLLLSNLWI